MAGSQSFGKRENEKKKQARRLEKQQRKEQRQAAGTASANDMIAWVDEFGNLTNVPPEERVRQKVEIKAEEIAVSTQRREEIDERLTGRVEHFNTEKGYGFIKDLASTEKYFFHISEAPNDISEGRKVTFELERGARGMNAVRIAYAE